MYATMILDQLYREGGGVDICGGKGKGQSRGALRGKKKKGGWRGDKIEQILQCGEFS
jgi:hypothetical protein